MNQYIGPKDIEPFESSIKLIALSFHDLAIQGHKRA